VLESANVVAFLATSKPEVCRKFYQETLGLLYLGDDGQTLIFDANGTTVRVQKVPSVSPASRTTLGWEVGDIIHAVKSLTAAGVAFERFPGLEQDRLGIWTAKTGTLVAWFRDPDGNLLSLSEHGAGS
jgi:catechol 2,3-dioxygenase-like lactoylglutathione lyase family enzyme